MKRSRRTRASLLAAFGGLALAAPTGAQAQAPAEAIVGPGASPEQALAAAEEALSPGGAAQPEATAALTTLGATYDELDRVDRRRARGLLTRPTDGAADQYGDGYPAGAPVASASSEHFCVFWVDDESYADAPDRTDGPDDGSVPDYVDEILAIAEHSYSVEVAPGPLGWRPPKPDLDGCEPDPSARSDIYLKQLGTFGLFGYESPDPGQGNHRRQHGYIVLDNDYAVAEYGFDDPLDAARVTFAHEFNHLLQVNYAVFQEVWLFEATATWVEDKVYPEINDYLNFVQSFANFPHHPITRPPSQRSLKAYGMAVWNHWLDGGEGGLGVAVIPAVWELSEQTKPKDFAIQAYDLAIEAAGSSSFSRQFAKFAGATAEWQTGDGGFPDAALLPSMRRTDTLRKGDRHRLRLDHTAMRLFDVRVPRGADRLKLRVRVEKGVRSGLAFVGRDGKELTGRVIRKSRFLRRGGRGSLVLKEVGRFERVSAVVVNADGRAKGLDRGGRNYTRDDSRFVVRLKT